MLNRSEAETQALSNLLLECKRIAERPTEVDWRAARPWLRWLQRLSLRVDERVRDSYCQSYENPKLHLGCGKHWLPGWLNTDYYPRGRSSAEIMHLDVTRRFPFEDGFFSHIYSEHNIEHLMLEQGIVMLMESFRVLRSGGRLRIATPSFRFLLGLYEAPETCIHERYMEYEAKDPNLPPEIQRLIVINKFVRAWGHQFIYDEALLEKLMQEVGFVDVRFCQIAESEDPVMRGLANIGRMPDGLLNLETFTIEGCKP